MSYSLDEGVATVMFSASSDAAGEVGVSASVIEALSSLTSSDTDVWIFFSAVLRDEYSAADMTSVFGRGVWESISSRAEASSVESIGSSPALWEGYGPAVLARIVSERGPSRLEVTSAGSTGSDSSLERVTSALFDRKMS